MRGSRQRDRGIRPEVSGIRIPGRHARARYQRQFGVPLLPKASGFTLIELLVAMTLLTVGLLGSARLTSVAITGYLSSRYLSTASVLGQDRMEDARRSRTVGLQAFSIEDYRTILGHPEFKRVVLVEDNKPGPGLRTLTVTVYWDDDARSLPLQTIVAP